MLTAVIADEVPEPVGKRCDCGSMFGTTAEAFVAVTSVDVPSLEADPPLTGINDSI